MNSPKKSSKPSVRLIFSCKWLGFSSNVENHYNLCNSKRLLFVIAKEDAYLCTVLTSSVADKSKYSSWQLELWLKGFGTCLRWTCGVVVAANISASFNP